MTETLPPRQLSNYGEVSFPENLPSEDNENMDSPWHRSQMGLLINVIETNWKGRNFYCGGNMFIHFSSEQVRNRNFRGPDFFIVRDVDHDRPRKYWAIWEENGRYPDVVVELLSPTTAGEDLTTKKAVYERTFKTHEYFCYDPDGEKLLGWRLSGLYNPIVPQGERLWSEELEMGLGTWKGMWGGYKMVWLRFFDRDGHLIPTGVEAISARANTPQIESANAERERANAGTARANRAEIEVIRLREEIQALRRQLARQSLKATLNDGAE